MLSAHWVTSALGFPNRRSSAISRGLPCPRDSNAAPARQLGRDLFANVDILVVNDVEAEMIFGVTVTNLPEATEAAALLSEQVANVVGTAGGLGLAVAEHGNTPCAETAHAVKLIDTHGAGDAFIGALAARWASSASVAKAVRFANEAAALLVTPRPTRKNGHVRSSDPILVRAPATDALK